MGFLPRQEVAREVSFARERGVKRFAALAPNSAYGHLMADSLKEIAASNGGDRDPCRIFHRRPRRSDQEDGAGQRRRAEFRRVAAARGRQSAEADRPAIEGRRGRPAQVHLLGSGLWDDPDIESEPALAGGWFAASPPETRQFFLSRYQGAYGHPPPRLASLAFDAAALAAVLAKSPDPDPFSQSADSQSERVYRGRRTVPIHPARSGAARSGGARGPARQRYGGQPGAEELPGFRV